MDRTQQEIKLLQEAAKRANTTLMKESEEGKAMLPGISIDEKRKILNQLGLRGLNKIKNVQAIMKKMRTE